MWSPTGLANIVELTGRDTPLPRWEGLAEGDEKLEQHPRPASPIEGEEYIAGAYIDSIASHRLPKELRIDGQLPRIYTQALK